MRWKKKKRETKKDALSLVVPLVPPFQAVLVDERHARPIQDASDLLEGLSLLIPP